VPKESKSSFPGLRVRDVDVDADTASDGYAELKLNAFDASDAESLGVSVRGRRLCSVRLGGSLGLR